ncbi:MAG: hypothetical protein BJBARM5_0566 [Candidatus Parvarchaeum acidophilus ARMAN-5]|jgi:phosphoglycolate phosphatase-like HAD superfamily hydrolase|uniref:Haloacid dehalogenase domain protein hydrolase n=1 Tax=Candidatus Parvarchaeum acidophilus ARMAN-5 TaxID=662762 RepID=D6GVQ3_PARA5|nr:MAG: hypothetical protein BJBARM5_0566 [Candidatus Parvarchaeum acidophilus ARMAN-5]
MKKRNAIIWDLDSTLIDTNKVFETAQKNLINNLSTQLLELGIHLDSEDKKEMDLLKRIDYEGIKIRGHTGYDSATQLPLSLLVAYLEKSDYPVDYKAAWLANKGLEIAKIEGSKYVNELEKIPDKFEGIEEILESSKDNYNIVFTEYFGDKDKQYKKILKNDLEKYFDNIIMTEKKDKFSILSAMEYIRLENGIKANEEFPIIYIEDRSKYLEMAKSIYPKCYTVNVLFGEKEIFGESFAVVDKTITSVKELKKFIQSI